MAHRGPDGFGYLGWTPGSEVGVGQDSDVAERAGVGLLHLRLSILDLSELGSQPMRTLDGRYWIVFNGEVYNFVELRQELEAQGETFRSGSDTEVVVRAITLWGKSALSRLVGMFAFALLDTQEQTLLLARDCFGIKPLYYTVAGNRLAFASEIKALLRVPDFKPTINAQRLYDYLRFGRTDDSAQTIIDEVHVLPPAHYVEIDLNQPSKVSPVRYWTLNPEPIDVSFKEATCRVRELFVESVRMHLRSDVPVGVCLSGGIDSSAIAMVMREVAGSALDLNTFSYVPQEAELSEEKWIDLVGQRCAARMHKISPDATRLEEDLDALVVSQDEPFGSTSIYAQRCVMNLVARHQIKVVLDGQGADEMLGGYRYFWGARLAGMIRTGQYGLAKRFLDATKVHGGAKRMVGFAAQYVLPTGMQGPLRKMVGQELAPAWLNESWFSARGVTMAPAMTKTSKHVLRDVLKGDIQGGLLALLRYEDRNSMNFSVESRVPFLTPQLAEYVISLPEKYLVSDEGESKHVFRAAMRGIVPDEILDRKDKVGFTTPMDRWLSELRPWAEARLNGPVAKSMEVLSGVAVQAEWQKCLAGDKKASWTIWRCLNLIRWAEITGVQF